MRHLAMPITLLVILLLFQSAPVVGPSQAQPFDPFERQSPILNGCGENSVFAILQTPEGRECLKYLPRASNAPTDYTLYCRGADWGCCIKGTGLGGACKITGRIPSQLLPRPPVLRHP